MAGNKAFARANRAKKDEFYTQLRDIETELRHYRDQFRGKVVFCNCDDPYESNFFKFFAMNFGYLGLKKLITTSYTGSPITGKQLSLLDIEGMPKDVSEKPAAYRVEITEVPDANNDGAIDLYDVEYLLKNERNVLTLLAGGGGDFRSAECIALLDEADIVVTNPPFSLFREYVGQLVQHDKQFLIFGNQNAITYSEIFKLFKEDRLWLGYDNGGEKWFRVPDDYDHTTDKSKIKVEDGVRYLAMKNMAWFTNLDTTKRHEELTLFKAYNTEDYPTYATTTPSKSPGTTTSRATSTESWVSRLPSSTSTTLTSSRSLATVGSSGRPCRVSPKKGTYQQGGPRFYLPNGDGTYRRMYDRIVIKRKSSA